jgi:predicted oxidoreductase|tara:strand:+ start:889 stop:1053 length:165 start_codon:yes stop_codon:yes gene_type:complete
LATAEVCCVYDEEIKKIVNSYQQSKHQQKTSFLGEVFLLHRPELAVASRAKSLT